MQPSRHIADLLLIMAKLRTPVTGCPWDLEQNFRSIAPYTIEEAYEVVDAIEREDFDDLPDELGDLLLQVVFHAQMAQELGLFDFGEVVERITAKMIRRHPHVFDDAQVSGAVQVRKTWAEIKAKEKEARPRADPGFFDDVPTALPALTRAVKLQARASRVGFDWNDARKVLDKIREETHEIEDAIDDGDPASIAGEIGDLFFALANLARHLDVDPESAVRASNKKFVNRFAFIERGLAARGRRLGEASLEEMDALWDAAKMEEG